MYNFFIFIQTKGMDKKQNDTLNNNIIENKTSKSSRKARRFSRNWKRRYIPIIASFAGVFIISLILVFVIPTSHPSPDNLRNENLAQNNGNWPRKVIAPFIDCLQ